MIMTLNRKEIENALLNLAREKIVATGDCVEEEAHYFDIYDYEGNYVDLWEISFVVPFVNADLVGQPKKAVRAEGSL